MEYKFLDKVFEQGDIPSLKLVDAKGYIDYIVNDRKKLLGITYEKGIENPLPFMDSILANNNLTNFFSDTVTDYERNATDGDWESVRANLVDVRRAILGA